MLTQYWRLPHDFHVNAQYIIMYKYGITNKNNNKKI